MKRKPTQQPKGKKGASKEKPSDDDECADMPPLEDMRNLSTQSKQSGSQSKEGTGSKASDMGKKAERGKEVDFPKVEWQEGEPAEWLKFVDDGVSGAYEHLGIDPSGSDEKVFEQLSKEISEIDIKSLENGSTNDMEKAGSILIIACSKSDSVNSAYKSLVLRLYIVEANALLSRLHLPLPRGTNPGEPLLPQTRSTTHSSPPIDPLSSGDKARLAKVESEGKKLRGENDELKTSLAAYKADVKEAFEARDGKEKENVELKEELANLKAENAQQVSKLEAENVSLRTTNLSKSPSSASSDKTDFVIQALSKQVKDLSSRLKEKNDQLAELMIEMTKSGYE